MVSRVSIYIGSNVTVMRHCPSNTSTTIVVCASSPLVRTSYHLHSWTPGIPIITLMRALGPWTQVRNHSLRDTQEPWNQDPGRASRQKAQQGMYVEPAEVRGDGGGWAPHWTGPHRPLRTLASQWEPLEGGAEAGSRPLKALMLGAEANRPGREPQA